MLLSKFELTGHSNLEKVLMQASSLASQTDTKASADPVAKYLPHLGIFYQQPTSVKCKYMKRWRKADYWSMGM